MCDMSDNACPQGRRTVRRCRCLVLAAAAVLVASVGLYLATRQNGMERRIAALRAAGYPTSLAELTERDKLPENAANAAALYLEAFAALVPPAEDTNVPLLTMTALPERGMPLPDRMVADIARCLAENQKCLSLLREAGNIEHCRYGWDWDYQRACLAPLRQCANLLRVAAVYQAQRGDGPAALASIMDSLRLSASLRREQGLIHYLVRMGCVGISLAGLERVLSATTCTDEQLRGLSVVLAEVSAELDLTREMVGECCFNIECWRDPSFLGASNGTPLTRSPATASGFIDTLARRSMYITMQDNLRNCVEASRLPPVPRLARFRQLDQELERELGKKLIERLSSVGPMLGGIECGQGRIAALDLRTQAQLAMARTALAIERHRLARGKVPEGLEELVPQYLEQVPVDPFDARPLRYRRTESGYLLYTILEDGQDNGGRERVEVGSEEPRDWCFIVVR
jgi:hypothetical protein